MCEESKESKRMGCDSSAVEPLLLLLKNARAAGAVSILNMAFDSPKVFTFGELLDMPNVKDLEDGPFASFFRLLLVFAYGTYKEYKAQEASLPKLSEAQVKKLRLLTIITLATRNKLLPYSLLFSELEISEVGQVEDLIIELIYRGFGRGKLDQKNQEVEFVWAVARDVPPSKIPDIKTVLTAWCNSCEEVLKMIKKEAERSTQIHAAARDAKYHSTKETKKAKRTMKVKAANE